MKGRQQEKKEEKKEKKKSCLFHSSGLSKAAASYGSSAHRSSPTSLQRLYSSLERTAAGAEAVPHRRGSREAQRDVGAPRDADGVGVEDAEVLVMELGGWKEEGG